MSFKPKRCEGCIGECPENCSWCMYSLCRKPVDEALLKFKWKQYCNDLDDYKLNSWMKEYFGLCN